MAANTRQSKHKAIVPVIDKARKSVAVLQAAGHPDLADAVTESLTYAEEAAARLARGNNFAGTPESYAIGVTEAFRKQVYNATANSDTGTPDVVRERMRDFLDGMWVPARPPRQSFGDGENRKVNINVRVPKVLWDAANEHGKDPDAVAERGYKLTASQVAIAALREHVGSSAQQDSTTA